MKHVQLITLFLLLLSCGSKDEGTYPQVKSLTELVYSSVTVQPDSLYQAYAIVSGILDRNLVEEGDVVSEGDTLLQIINNAPKLNALNAKYSLDLAREKYKGKATVLNGIHDQINAATLRYRNDSLNYFRQKKLWEQNIGSKIEFDTKKLAYELSLNELHSLQNTYEQTENELETAVKQSENNYRTALIGTRDFSVKSKINGKIYALYKEPGEIVNTMEPLASIGSVNNFVIDMLVDEVDIVCVTPGQDVLIFLDAYEGTLFEGHISKIYPKKDERNQTFKIEAVFKNPPNVLYPGLSGEANIIISKKDSALTIPKAYLIDGSMVKTEEGLIAVGTGLQNLEFIEITSGISEDTFIYKPQ
ncbi:efflux RND transporter periplasmic adaptor subunit [Aestuariivivens sediminicola]|uniref:efflux RND transporter periplasmic adaptor subunit n=1 Tax=Aestuariivivens sediminicola TaxID=2913560 RepID=UPI001F569CC3|nr:efflux RND transporter periplasmic adaptor subunit [Aestuariivivens sediminicola]